jgi:aryl-alcohol dehydrogenase-like predicted oxidoreductase
MGARKPSRVEETAGAAGWRLSPEALAAIESLLEKRALVG